MATITDYKTKEDIIIAAERALGKTLRDIVDPDDIPAVEQKFKEYGTNRKGFFGDLVEQYVFGIKNNARPEADFALANIELKTTPLKEHGKKQYVSKERLVFSMINYDTIINESWKTSSFLKKNQFLLLMFYLWLKEQNLLDYEFKFVHFLDLLSDISVEDILQIQKDWEFIVDKIRCGEAHLLSEGDTFYLGACTKASNSRVVRDQPNARIPAKPRAFSLKQTYLNYLIQSKLLGKEPEAPSIYRDAKRKGETIEEVIADKFHDLIGKTSREIMKSIGWKTTRRPKNFKRLLVNHIMTGTGSNHVEELEKANVTLRVLTLEHTGTLKESISFPAFDYRDLVSQVWYDEKKEALSDLYAQLEMNRFLFVIFKKQKGSQDIVLNGFRFWNFPAADMEKAQRVWEETVRLIKAGKIVKKVEKGKVKTFFPGSTFNGVVHVRPHGADSKDTNPLPVADKLTGRKAHTKQCFWLNASYIQHAIESANDQY